MDALTKAVKILGSQAELARRIGVPRQSLQQWPPVPPKYVWAIERATGGKVKCHELRPDIFPPR